MMKSTIIIATDLTEASEEAINTGINWANNLKCEVALLHIHKKKILEAPLHKKLYAQICKFRSAQVKIKSLILHSEKIEKYIEITKDINAKILVIPYIESEFDRFIAGKAVDRLIRISPVPVLVVKNSSSYAPKNVILPFDSSGFSEDATDLAEVICESFNACLVPIHLYTKTNSDRDSYTLEELQELDDGDTANYLNMKNKLVRLSRKGIIKENIIKSSEYSKSKEKLLSELNKLNSDLIIMGSSGKKGLERLYLGSFCEHILQNSTSSLLITKKF